MLCAFPGLPSFVSSWDDSMWYSVCTTGRSDLLKAFIVSDLSERAASCTRIIGEENSIEVAHIAITFVGIVFSLGCSTSSYSIELVTELSCLLFYISTFLIFACFTTAHFSLVCFLQLSVSSSHLLRSLLISCSSFTTVLVGMAQSISCQKSMTMRSCWNIQAFNDVKSSELSILLNPLQVATLVCRLPITWC